LRKSVIEDGKHILCNTDLLSLMIVCW